VSTWRSGRVAVRRGAVTSWQLAYRRQYRLHPWRAMVMATARHSLLWDHRCCYGNKSVPFVDYSDIHFPEQSCSRSNNMLIPASEDCAHHLQTEALSAFTSSRLHWDLWHPPNRARHTLTRSTSPQPTGFTAALCQDARGEDGRAQSLISHQRLTAALLGRAHGEIFQVKDQPAHSNMAQPNPGARNKAHQSETAAPRSTGLCRVRPRVLC